MLVTLSGQKSITVDLPCEVTWAVSNSQTFGSARLTIPRNSAAWDSDIVSEKGGFLVRVNTRFGDAVLIADSPEYTPVGMTVECLHVSAWCQIRHVAPYRVFHGVTAGTIARRAVMDALVGLGSVPVTIGAMLQAPPVLSEFSFKQQSLLDVLTELSQRTGHQWEIDNQMILSWVQQVGRFREFVLIDDGFFLDKLQRKPLADQIAESIEIEPGGRTYTARNNGVPALWPSQEIVRV